MKCLLAVLAALIAVAAANFKCKYQLKIQSTHDISNTEISKYPLI